MQNQGDHQSPALLEVVNASVAYNGAPALIDLTFQIPQGGQLALAGPNGAGKSTLFKALVGLIPVHSGRVLIHGLPLESHKDCVAYVPQREEVDWRFPVTVEDVVMMGRFRRQGWLKRPDHSDHDAVHHSLEAMGMLSLAKRSINELSGGQQQRIFLARALAQEPHILLMDEPFTGVDISTQEATLALLEGLRQKNVTVIVATHDLSMAAQRFESILLLNHRLIAFGSPVQVLTPENIRTAFGGKVLFLQDTVVFDECCPPEGD